MNILSWNIEKLVDAMRISKAEVLQYFRDGRRVSFIIERRIANEVLFGHVAESEGAAFDVLDEHGNKWEIRSISKGGIYFCPSYMVGSGRHFEKAGFLAKLDEIEGYVVADITAFPDVPCWKIPSDVVRAWWNENKLGTTTKITRDTAFRLINSLRNA